MVLFTGFFAALRMTANFEALRAATQGRPYKDGVTTPQSVCGGTGDRKGRPYGPDKGSQWAVGDAGPYDGEVRPTRASRGMEKALAIVIRSVGEGFVWPFSTLMMVISDTPISFASAFCVSSRSCRAMVMNSGTLCAIMRAQRGQDPSR